jgi:hypothetical protein
LKRIYVSLRDEMSTPTDWFEPMEVPSAASDARGEGGGAGTAGSTASAADKAKAACGNAPSPRQHPQRQWQRPPPSNATLKRPKLHRRRLRLLHPPARWHRHRSHAAASMPTPSPEQMQCAADKGDADRLDALAERVRDMLDKDLRATLTAMYERLRVGLDRSRPIRSRAHGSRSSSVQAMKSDRLKDVTPVSCNVNSASASVSVLP